MLNDQQVQKVLSLGYDEGRIANLRIIDANGTQTIYDKNCRHSAYTEQTREIPVNHHIVGVYGKCTPNNYINYLGFIIAEF